MYQAADLVVKSVMIGLLIASLVTWTVWLAKTLELLAAKRACAASFGGAWRPRDRSTRRHADFSKTKGAVR